MSQTIDD